MRIRAIRESDKRIPRKHKKRLFGTRRGRTEVQWTRYLLDYVKGLGRKKIAERGGIGRRSRLLLLDKLLGQ